MRCERCQIRPAVMRLAAQDGRTHRLCGHCLHHSPELVRGIFASAGDRGDDPMVDQMVERLLARVPDDDSSAEPSEDPRESSSEAYRPIDLDEREAWRQQLRAWCPRVEMRAPAKPHELDDIEKALGVALPRDLRVVLAASNGVRTPIGTPVWTATTILETNRLFRTEMTDLYMPFAGLLFFGDDGDGDQFAFRIVAGEVDARSVYRWSHDDDSRTWFAGSLGALLERLLRRSCAA